MYDVSIGTATTAGYYILFIGNNTLIYIDNNYPDEVVANVVDNNGPDEGLFSSAGRRSYNASLETKSLVVKGGEAVWQDCIKPQSVTGLVVNTSPRIATLQINTSPVALERIYNERQTT